MVIVRKSNEVLYGLFSWKRKAQWKVETIILESWCHYHKEKGKLFMGSNLQNQNMGHWNFHRDHFATKTSDSHQSRNMTMLSLSLVHADTTRRRYRYFCARHICHLKATTTKFTKISICKLFILYRTKKIVWEP